MVGFREVLDFYSLNNLSFQVQKFTWANNRQGSNFTKEKLNRVLSNLLGLDQLIGSHYLVLPAIKSNLSPLLLYLTMAPSNLSG